jgi:hypothetical protein
VAGGLLCGSTPIRQQREEVRDVNVAVAVKIREDAFCRSGARIVACLKREATRAVVEMDAEAVRDVQE